MKKVIRQKIYFKIFLYTYLLIIKTHFLQCSNRLWNGQCVGEPLHLKKKNWSAHKVRPARSLFSMRRLQAKQGHSSPAEEGAGRPDLVPE
jgi:hypothetical protein